MGIKDMFTPRSKKDSSKAAEQKAAAVPAAPAGGGAAAAPAEDPDVTLAMPDGMPKVGIDDFDLLKVLGKGGFGKVMLVRKKGSTDIYAMKVLKKEAVVRRNQVVHTKTERHILKQIRHPFLTRMYFAFQSEGKLYMVLNYLPGGELFYRLKREGRFSVERVRLYGAEIAAGLGHLHSMDMIYRDLKPENILLDEVGHICLTDFGLSKESVATPNAARTFCGTPEYLAPEILQGVGHGKGVDWWSLGTLIFEMLTGLPPFYSRNINHMYEKILKAELRCPSFLPADVKGLIEGLLIRDPIKRLGSGDGLSVRQGARGARVLPAAQLRESVQQRVHPYLQAQHRRPDRHGQLRPAVHGRGGGRFRGRRQLHAGTAQSVRGVHVLRGCSHEEGLKSSQPAAGHQQLDCDLSAETLTRPSTSMRHRAKA